MVRDRAGGFFVSGGTLPLDSRSYVERDCDIALHAALSAGRYCYVLNTRQMGKSSLSVRVLARLESEGCRTACIDLTQMGGRNVSPEQWYTGLAVELGRALGLRKEVLDFCRGASDFAPLERFFGAIRDVVLKHIDEPIVLCIDEIDATRNLSFDADEFFAGVRECYNHRVRDPAYRRLTVCMLGVAVPTDLIRNSTTTPFNIGERVYLRDFTLAEMQKLAAPLGRNGNEIIERIHYWTNGHPFLTQSLCSECLDNGGISSAVEVDAIVNRTLFGPKARDRNINLADVANRALNAGAAESDPEHFRGDILSMYGRVLRGKRVLDDEANRVASLLKLSGLVRSDGSCLRKRNRIYERVFDGTWIRDNMPGQELLRLKQSFRRGLLRAFALSAAVLAAVGFLAFRTWRSEVSAVSARHALDQELFVADMNNLRSFEEDGDVGRAAEVLKRTERSPYRGFEWGFWMRRLHDSPEEYTLDFSAPGKRETGILSWNGAQLCILDDLTGCATIVDRATHRAISRTRRRNSEEVVATPSGFVAVDHGVSPEIVTSLPERRPVSTVGDPGRPSEVTVTRPQAQFVVTMQTDQLQHRKVIEVWRIADGKSLFTKSYPVDDYAVPIAFSVDGRRLFVASINSSKALSKPYIEALDTSTGQVIDRVEVSRDARALDIANSGREILYLEGPHVLIGRDVDLHRTVYRHDFLPSDSLASVCFSGGDSIVALMDLSGRAAIESYPGGRNLGSYQNVWGISSSRNRPQIIAGSTSVRVLSFEPAAESGLLLPGDRIGRDGRGHVYVFVADHGGVVQYSDPSLAVEERISSPVPRTTYTYNGLWRLSVDPVTQTAFFDDAAGRLTPLAVRPPPANFSCGLSRRVVVTYTARRREIRAISGITGKTMWIHRTDGDPSNGLWMSPDSQIVLVFVGQKSILVLDGDTGATRASLTPHNQRISGVTFTRDGKGFFTFGFDGRAILWSVRTLKPSVEFRGNDATRVSSADLSPDGRRVATTTEGGLLQIWDADTGTQLTSVHASPVPLHGVLFTSDGRTVVTVDANRVVRAWPSLSGDPSVRLPVSPELLAGLAH
jgi:WD40 repeat protein